MATPFADPASKEPVTRPARPRHRLSNTLPYAEMPGTAPAGWVDRMLLRGVGTLGWRLQRYRRGLSRFADRTIAQEAAVASLSADALAARVLASRARLLHEVLQSDGALAEAFALAREATFRVLGFRHHKVQLMGGRAMLDGRLIEMRTGEGKTVTALLAAAVKAMAGVPAHVITVNDYLAERDCAELRPIYTLLGLSVGLVMSECDRDARAAAYACDVTYCTNKDVVFDYLKDRMAIGQRRGLARRGLATLGADDAAGLILRGLHFAVIDEADNVLVDEARTPLILSASLPTAGEEEARRIALNAAAVLEEGIDFQVRATARAVDLLEAAAPKLADALTALERIPGTAGNALETVNQAVTALHCYRRDIDYIIDDGKIQIVDEFTGRVMPDRSWQAGLHQMIEAKEGCEATAQRGTIARISYQRFFRRYLSVCGMSGTIAEVAGEMYEQFGTPLARIPTHSPDVRIDHGARLMASRSAKWQAVAQSAAHFAALGRPVLIGTTSVSASEELSAVLRAGGLAHVTLNARQNAEEADIVAQGGQPGRITVATNMAGRGTDIKLKPAARTAGGLHVILTEYHESARIDRQLFGRAGRQGDPGSYEAIVALDDRIFTQFLAPWELRLAGALQAESRFGGRLVLHLMRRACQRRAERANRRMRDSAVQRDHQLADATAFSGASE